MMYKRRRGTYLHAAGLGGDTADGCQALPHGVHCGGQDALLRGRQRGSLTGWAEAERGRQKRGHATSLRSNSTSDGQQRE